MDHPLFTRYALLPFILFLIGCASIAVGSAKTEEVRSITVLADKSLTLPITEITRHYSRDHFITVSASFSSVPEQLELIEQGAEANVFLTDRHRSIVDLNNMGLLDVYSISSFIENRLVLAASATNDMRLSLSPKEDGSPKADLSSTMEPINPDFSFAIIDAEYEGLGGYSIEALSNMNLLKQVEPRLVILQDSTDLSNIIARNNLGLVYLSDILTNPALRVVDTIPQDYYSPIVYQASVVAGDNMDAARGFLNYLKGETAQDIFAKYGFLPVTHPDKPKTLPIPAPPEASAP